MNTAKTKSFLTRNPGEILHLTGKTVYKYVQEIDNNVLADQFCPNEVQITFLEGQKIEIFIIENGVCGGRSFYAYGQITPSDAVTFEYAVPVISLPDGTAIKITDVIKGHLGCILSGPGIDRGTIVFNGKFEGETLIATSNFIAICEIEWPANNIFPTPVNGPVLCSWTFDMTTEE